MRASQEAADVRSERVKACRKEICINRQRRIQAAEIDATGAIAEALAQDKQMTRMLLEQVGVPVPRGRVATSVEEACRAAAELGFPVVVWIRTSCSPASSSRLRISEMSERVSRIGRSSRPSSPNL
jgi:carbamoylphosphate synthase large subunit